MDGPSPVLMGVNKKGESKQVSSREKGKAREEENSDSEYDDDD